MRNFPFMKAIATYRQISEVIISLQGSSFIAKVTSKTDNRLKIKRTLTALKIIKAYSTGKSKIRPI